MRVMLAAIRCGNGDLDANLASHLHVVGEARAASCNVVLFPEMSLTGSVDPATHPQRLITLSHPAVRELVAASARAGARLVLGRRAVLTPLARDRARATGVEIVKER